MCADGEGADRALWMHLSLACQAYQEFLEKQAAAAGVDDLSAFRGRLMAQRGGGSGAGSAVDAAAAAEELLAAAAADARDAGGKALPQDLLARLASLGAPSAGAGGGASGSGRGGAVSPGPAVRGAAPRRAPLVEELPPKVRLPAAPAAIPQIDVATAQRLTHVLHSRHHKCRRRLRRVQLLLSRWHHRRRARQYRHTP
jgi:hypothetical protein